MVDHMRIMGIDLGTRRIGVALSDQMCMLAHGRGAIERISDEKAISRIIEIVSEEKVERIVVGFPLNMDGTEGPRAVDSRKFVEKLMSLAGVDVILWDERLSTKEAEDVLIQADVGRKKRRKVVDKMAAQLILQGYLDSLD